MTRDPVTAAVRDMVEKTDTTAAFAAALGRELEWRLPESECVRRVRQMLNGQHYRHLPAQALLVAIRVTRLDYVTPLLQRELIRLEDREAAEPEKPGVRAVRPGERRLRDAG